MNPRNYGLALLTLTFFSVTSLADQSVSTSGSETSTTTKKSMTADNQSMSQRDVEITSLIRQRLIADPSLSLYSQNVKIITQDGVVTLKGPVRSRAERDRIASVAREIAGRNAVFNELEIAR